MSPGSEFHSLSPGGEGWGERANNRLSRRRLLVLTGSAAIASLIGFPGKNAAAQTPDDRVVRRVLSNGLVVLVDARQTADTVAVQLTARDGSRNDPDLPGISVLTS